ncbi:MAG: 1-acyl-sn-glycerol-3-phosphate acyltransferase [Tannerellaceae bacterium]|nr:1-acyl-sn-glycerol-3-phosphate acyltransferase [Tannerellaceae bacterium]
MVRTLYVIYLCLVAIPLFLIFTLITALTVIVGCLLGGEKIFAYYPGMIWSRLTCYLALCPVKVIGKEKIVKKQPYIFVANHQGAFDIFLIYGFLGVPIKWFMKAGIGKIPFVGVACRAAGFIFVNNSTPKSATQSVSQAEQRLRNGASIAIFPEGSRTYDGKMISFKKGAFQMALDQQLPIVPLTLNGPFDVLPIDSFKIKRHRMELIIHDPIDTFTQEHSNKNLRHMAEQTQKIIYASLWEKYQ